MKYSKRYIVLTIVIAIVFLLKFQVMELDNSEIGKFRGGTLSAKAWYPLIAEDVNSKLLRVVIDNKEYTSEQQNFFMDNNRNIMVPVSILRDALNCSSHIYQKEQLLVEKHDLSALFTLDEDTALSTGEKVSVESPFTKVEEEYYVSINDLSDMLGYGYNFDMQTNTLTTADLLENASILPASYDLREKKRVSSIRNQGQYGTCWAFAATSAMESALLPEEGYVFSVDHMSMSNSFNLSQYDGGEYTMGMAYLAAWQGPVYEKDDPYGDGVSDDTLKAIKHVQEMRIIGLKDMQAIKEAVFQYGGVQTSLYSSLRTATSSSQYYNKETKAYCYIGTEKPNHAVTIIGWDDNYSKDNFNVPLEGDGAFICQNSWGTTFGEEGIFYVSYYDTNIGSHNVVYTRIDDNDNYDNIYQSDLCGWVGKLGYDREEIYGANVFKAKKDEEVVAASFYATAPNTRYKIYVVDNFKNIHSFTEKELVAEGSVEKAGYYTIDFAQGVQVQKNSKYAVVVYIYTPGATHPLAIEYDMGSEALENIDLEDGEGYISYSGKNFINVKEKQDCNLCIKAFTNNQ
ncbi:MAG: cell surface protein [Lachnospiraceae bacterium]|nr:cell surface protein [Lachnospiraceae bacterium]